MKFTNETVGGSVEILVGLTTMHTTTPIKVAVPDSAASAAVSGTGITAATVTASTFASKLGGGTYTFAYSTAWKLGGETVTLSDYGITATGTAASGDTITVTFNAAAATVKAGTPLTAVGASTTGANAVGILLYDVDTSENPNGTIVQSGPIDSTKAQAHSGVTYVAALYTALPAVQFRTDIGTNE